MCCQIIEIASLCSRWQNNLSSFSRVFIHKHLGNKSHVPQAINPRLPSLQEAGYTWIIKSKPNRNARGFFGSFHWRFPRPKQTTRHCFAKFQKRTGKLAKVNKKQNYFMKGHKFITNKWNPPICYVFLQSHGVRVSVCEKHKRQVQVKPIDPWHTHFDPCTRRCIDKRSASKK